MKITASKEIFRKYPGLHIGIILAKNIENTGTDKRISGILHEVEDLIRFEFTPESLTQIKGRKLPRKHQLLSAWKTAYEDLGFNPAHYKTPLEKMIQALLKRKSLPNASKIIGCTRLIALKHIVPVTAYDLDKLPKEVSLTDKLEPKNCASCNVSEKSKNCIILIHGLPPVSKSDVNEMANELSETVKMFCKGETSKYLLSVLNNKVELNEPTKIFR